MGYMVFSAANASVAWHADLTQKKNKKEQLEHDVHMCTVKLDRAQKLITGLGGEKTRWNASADRLAMQLDKLTGDVLLAAAQIAYLGPFTAGVLLVCSTKCIGFSDLKRTSVHTNST